mmetsp:Transcript_21531/g.47334  ORF Transcript_21531/g.47334 Transcript_21531/m.47334 type:complete len:207 (+) Transcript_21531:500-1120(+)
MYSRPFGARCLTSAPASPSASILASSLACFFFHSSVRRFLSHATGSCKRSFSSSTAAVFATRPAFIFCLSSQSLFSLSFLNRTGGGAGASPSSSDSCPDSSFGSSSSAPDPNRTFFASSAALNFSFFSVPISWSRSRVPRSAGSTSRVLPSMTSPEPITTTGTRGRSCPSTGTFSIARIISMPSTTCPKAVCRPSIIGQPLRVTMN